jgi:sugar phosphate isomerase/epimerase
MGSPFALALQLYSVREACAEDLPGTLAKVAEMGYDGVEFAGYHGRDAAQIARLLKETGLRAAGTHTRIETLLTDEAFGETAAFNREIGNRNLIVPGLGEEYIGSAEAWERTARLFNDLAARAAAEGMRVGYHNHWHEFTPFPDGRTGWEILAEATSDEVLLQFDTGNARCAGVEILPFLTRWPGRSLSVHVKECNAAGIGTRPKGLIGEGDVPWADVLAFCREQGATEWLVVEQEDYALPPLECVEVCLRNLRGLLEE